MPSECGSSSASSSNHSQAKIIKKHKVGLNLMHTDPSVFGFPVSPSSMGCDFVYFPKVIDQHETRQERSMKYSVTHSMNKLKRSGRGKRAKDMGPSSAKRVAGSRLQRSYEKKR